MGDVCNICEEPFEEQPLTELMCHHRCHTDCFIANLGTLILTTQGHPETLRGQGAANEPLRRPGAANEPQLRCATCQQGVFVGVENQEEDEEQEEEEKEEEDNVSVHSNFSVTQRTRVHNLWETNENFRADVKKYMKAKRAAAKPCMAFQRLVATKRNEIRQLYLPMKLQIEALYSNRKDQIVTSQEYKEYQKAKKSYEKYFTNIRDKYGVGGYALSFLREKPGCKTFSRPSYRYHPSSMIRRALYFRPKY